LFLKPQLSKIHLHPAGYPIHPKCFPLPFYDPFAGYIEGCGSPAGLWEGTAAILFPDLSAKQKKSFPSKHPVPNAPNKLDIKINSPRKRINATCIHLEYFQFLLTAVLPQRSYNQFMFFSHCLILIGFKS
jgi:hypothetical protein